MYPKYSVIYAAMPVGGQDEGKKLFVVLGYKMGYFVCAKTTSQLGFYQNNPDRLSGVVFFKAGDGSCFEQDTYVQPDNTFPIAPKSIISCIGQLPEDFDEKLKYAINNSITIDATRKRGILDLIS